MVFFSSCRQSSAAFPAAKHDPLRKRFGGEKACRSPSTDCWGEAGFLSNSFRPGLLGSAIPNVLTWPRVPPKIPAHRFFDASWSRAIESISALELVFSTIPASALWRIFVLPNRIDLADEFPTLMATQLDFRRQSTWGGAFLPLIAHG